MMEATTSVAIKPEGPSVVRQVPAAPPDRAFAHFMGKAAFETDCADVHTAFASGRADFVLLDVRGRDAYRKGHIAGAISMPLTTISEKAVNAYADDTFFVVYCAGPQCNGSTKAAAQLARLGRPVKEMIGGISGWLEDGYDLIQGGQPGV